MLETKEKNENTNNSNNVITKIHLLNKILKQVKILEIRIRARIAKALNGRRIESGKQPGHKIRQKYRKYGLRNIEINMKEGKHTGKIENLMKPGDENKNRMI